MSADQRARVVLEARSWLGTPYHHAARVKGAGVDCATLLCEVYAAAGVTSPIELDTYPHDWHLHHDVERYLHKLSSYAHEVESPQTGDVILWRFGRCFSHGAIYIGDGLIIHSYLGQGCRIERMDSQIFARRPVKYFSLWE